MAQPSTINFSTSLGSRRIELPSRLIPGAQLPSLSASWKKASSASVDTFHWESRDVPEPLRPEDYSPWRTLAEAILPAPAAANQRLTLAVQVLADLLLITVAFAVIASGGVILTLAPRSDFDALPSPLPFPPSVLGLLWLYAALCTLLGYSERLYHPETVNAPRQERRILAKVVFWSTLLVGAALWWSEIHIIPIATLSASAPLSFLLMLAWRKQRRRMSGQYARNGSGERNVLIIGAGKIGRTLASHLERDHVRKLAVKGFIDESEPIGGDIRGRTEDFARIARSEFVDEIILTVPQDSDVARKVIWEARRNRIDVKLVPHLFGFDPTAISCEKFGDVPILTLCEERVPAFGLLLKRTIDVMLSTVGSILAGPLLAAIALAIKLDSPGPMFYRAPRIGRKGRSFLCCKFRTMVTDADKLKENLRQDNEREGPFFKIMNDPRVTHVGRILRRYSLDELPQLWNVLRGDMSLVGPRPHPLDDFARYDLHDLQRLEVTPGLTGLWQVTARHDPSFERSMALDREYIGHWSLTMDFRILCKTIGVVLRGEGT